MVRYVLTSLAVFCCVSSITLTASAQSTPRKPAAEEKDTPAAAKTGPENEAARLKEARSEFAIQAISSLADEARNYKEPSLRVRVQAEAADALWSFDRSRARALFVRAWDAAEVGDDEGRRRNQEERRRVLSGRDGPHVIAAPPNLRIEVLRLAGLHDRALAESFLARMKEKEERDEKESKESKPWDPTEPPDIIAKRLQLAQRLLESGDSDSALLLAEPALNQVTSQGIMFLVLLRAKNAALADQVFAALLERTRNDPLADATSVSLLSSYVFTPSVLVTDTRNGVLVSQWTAKLPPPQLSRTLSAQFFSVASQVLLRPAGALELETSSAGLAGTCFVIERLLPLFDQNDPNMAAALRGRLNTLTEGQRAVIPEPHRSLLNAGFKPQENGEEDPDAELARIERAPSTRDRDHLYALAASAAVKRSDPKARDLADKIDDSSLRANVRGFIDFILISRFLEKKDVERALQLTRASELTHLQRAWSYLEAAALLKSSAPDQAVALVNEGTTEAERISVTDVESAQAWVAIAKRAPEVTPASRWAVVPDAIKAMNKVPGYRGDEHEIPVRFQSRSNIEMMQIPAPSINLTGLFQTLADEDIYRAAELAKTITGEYPRAIALLALGRSALVKERTRH